MARGECWCVCEKGKLGWQGKDHQEGIYVRLVWRDKFLLVTPHLLVTNREFYSTLVSVRGGGFLSTSSRDGEGLAPFFYF